MVLKFYFVSLLCSYEKIITHFNTVPEVVYLSSNNMHFLTVWEGLMENKVENNWHKNNI